MSKLTLEVVQAIREAEGSNRELARRFGVHPTTISNIQTGRTWAASGPSLPAEKRCGRCGMFKPAAEFYRDSKAADGFRAFCKPCSRARSREPKSYSTEWRRRNREKSRAHRRVDHAIRMGRLTRSPTCEECGREAKTHGHHEDYSRPLDVRWLCRNCHVAVHSSGAGG